MKNSDAYQKFYNQTDATGKQRMDGYDPNLMEKFMIGKEMKLKKKYGNCIVQKVISM